MQGSLSFADVCSGVEEADFESCDCSQIVGGVGPFSCTLLYWGCFNVTENYCACVTYEGEVSFGIAAASELNQAFHSPCCTCLLSHQIKADGSETFDFCYKIIAPYAHSLCYGYDFSQNDSNDTSCAVRVDGVACSSCARALCATSSPDKEGKVWGCTNAVAASLGAGVGNQ